MVEALNNADSEVNKKIKEKDRTIITSPNRLDLTYFPGNISDLKLRDFVSCRTKLFFGINQLNTDFLALHPGLWETNGNYKNQKEKIRYLMVVNDCAERAVALYGTFKGELTKKEGQRQSLLQVVERNRKTYSTLSKAEIVNN